MPDTEKNNPPIPEARVVSKKRSRLSFVWIVPIVAAAAGLWIAINTVRNQGPTITIAFKSAEGLTANKTVIRYNGVEVGEIISIALSDDYQTVIATARMSPRTDHFLKKDTQFWVVRPEISGASVSGLSTIISGAFIGMVIGDSKESSRHFVALDDQPLEANGVTGRYFNLTTSTLGSLSKGTPVYFRQLRAGQVSSYQLDPSGKFLNVKVFIQSPYDQFITADTRFWQASGIDLSLNANGMHIQTESLLAILIGGIAFETPLSDTEAAPAAENTSFALNADRQQAFRPPAQHPLKLTLVFTESLRGLAVGAPVELEGIPIGEVTEIHAQLDAETFKFAAPVTVTVDPARYGVDVMHLPADASAEEVALRQHRGIDALVAHGLRAQLKTGSLISGSHYVALDFFPNAQPVTLDWSQTPVQLPTVPSQMEMLEAAASRIINKVDQLPLQQVVGNLNETITNATRMVVSVNQAVTNLNQLETSVNQTLAPDSEFNAELLNLLQQGGSAAQSLRLLEDYLERHPEALLQGKPGSAK